MNTHDAHVRDLSLQKVTDGDLCTRQMVMHVMAMTCSDEEVGREHADGVDRQQPVRLSTLYAGSPGYDRKENLRRVTSPMDGASDKEPMLLNTRNQNVCLENKKMWTPGGKIVPASRALYTLPNWEEITFMLDLSTTNPTSVQGRLSHFPHAHAARHVRWLEEKGSRLREHKDP